MLLGTLGVNLLGNILAGKGISRAGRGIKRAGEGVVGAGYGILLKKKRIFNAASSFN